MQKQGPPPDLGQKQKRPRDLKENGNKHLQGKKRTASGEVKSQQSAKISTNGTSVAYTKRQKSQDAKPVTKSKPPASSTSVTRKHRIKKIVPDTTNANAEIELDEQDDISSEEMDDDEMDELEQSQSLGDDLMDSNSSVYDSDMETGKARFSDDEDSDAMEKLNAANIEGLSRKLDRQQEEEEVEAQRELEENALQINIDGDASQVLDETEVSGPTLSKIAPDLQLLRSRMTDTIRILDNLPNLADKGRSRVDYTSQLLKDICLYYGYSAYLAEKLFNLFSPREAFEFFEANETARPVVIRTNTLRTHRRQLAQTLINRGVTLEPIGKWSKVGLQIFESQVPLGATPEYLAGHYILQAASSFLPVMALAPQEHERILDMAAAPGGKTTYMAALMKNTGCIFANDNNKARAKGLIGNVHRLGVKNSIICSYDAQEFPRVIGGFDRVLLDAPCSGTGVIAKDPSVKTNKTETDFLKLPYLQKQLLLSAIDSVDHASKTGGYIVYSTCSVTVEENEQVVEYALRKRPNVKLVETGLIFGRDGFTSHMGKNFDAHMKMTKRYYPHAYNVDGFFVSKFKKIGPTPVSMGHQPVSGNSNDHAEIEGEKHQLITEDDLSGNDFGGFDDEEDQVYMERARRRRLKRKGIDPRSIRSVKNINGQRTAPSTSAVIPQVV